MIECINKWCKRKVHINCMLQEAEQTTSERIEVENLRNEYECVYCYLL